MKKNYLFAGILIVVIAVVIAVVMVIVFGDGNEGENEIEEAAETIDISYLEEMQLNPPDDYVQKLEDIILSGTDSYIQERGIFTLTDIAIREGDAEEIIDFLKDIAYGESNDDIRTAAYANVDLIRKTHPLPERGSMEIKISGKIGKGNTITLTALISSSIEVSDAIVGIEKMHKDIELLSPPATNVHLDAGETVTFECELMLNETGKYIIPVTLMLSFDRLDYEEINREVVITVNEDDGEYDVTEPY